MALQLDRSLLLIKNTTKEQRKKMIEGGIAINSLDAVPLNDFAIKMFQKYIDGEMELDEVREKFGERAGK